MANFVAAAGIPRQLHIWAQPRTAGVGDWSATSNPFLAFQNASLNVLSPQSSFNVDPSSIVVHNPSVAASIPRFASVGDSSTGLQQSTGAEPGPYDDLPPGFSKGLLNLQGYSIPATSGAGFGPTCHSFDDYCALTVDGSPAWLFASLTVAPTSDMGLLEFWLQIGLNGMNHASENSGDMTVEFGVDSIGLTPNAYDADLDRQVTFADDDADAVLRLAGPGDYNGDGMVDAADYAVWKTQFASNSYDADGNGDSFVNLADYAVWRDHLQASSPPIVAASVPELASVRLLAALLVPTVASSRVFRAKSTSTTG